MRIDCRFPGGNIKVHDICGDALYVSPDLRDTRTSWFYWAFRVTGGAGRTLVFHFISDRPVGVKGPAISTDERLSWQWTEEPFDENTFRVTIPPHAHVIYLAFAPLYTQENWDRFIAAFPEPSAAEMGFFTKSRKGRDVELVHIGQRADTAKHRVIVTARHHCCEMIASYVMEGFIEHILIGTSAQARYLRQHVSFSCIPFVDKDGVEDGDQGKNRAPRDHNRDYDDTPIYPETAAVMKLTKALARHGGVDIFMDLHCPWIRGESNEHVYQVGRKEERNAHAQLLFGRILEQYADLFSLPYRAEDTLAYGTGWNTDANTADGVSCTGWAGSNPQIGFTTSFEIPYANARQTTVTAQNARQLGRALAQSVADFLQR